MTDTTGTAFEHFPGDHECTGQNCAHDHSFHRDPEERDPDKTASGVPTSLAAQRAKGPGHEGDLPGELGPKAGESSRVR